MVSRQLEIGRVRLAAFVGNVKADALAFVQSRKPGALDGTDMYEHVRPTAIWLNKPEALTRIKPFHFARRHHVLLFAVLLPFVSSQSIVRLARRAGPARYSWMLT